MPEIECMTFEKKSFLMIRVPRWRGPFYLKSKGPTFGVYVRLGSTNREAGPELLAEMQRALSDVSFDQMPCPEVDSAGLDKNRIEVAFSSVGKKVDQMKLETLGVLVPYSGKLVCSNGGVILFGKEQFR